MQADGIQSVHDKDATYRRKNDQITHGYHVQVTETCSQENPFQMIVDVGTYGAHESESEFLPKTIERTNDMLEKKSEPEQVEVAIADGGYYSRATAEWAADTEDAPKVVLTNARGGNNRYIFKFDSEDCLEVYDAHTGEQCKVEACHSNKNKVVITNSDEKKRYFTWTQIEIAITKQMMLSYEGDYSNIRANVESTIHQAFCKLQRRRKTKYRGKHRTHLYVLSRVIWTNFTRISKKIEREALILVKLMFSSHMENEDEVIFNINFRL